MYHFHVRYITKGSGASSEAVLDYMARTGRYKSRGDTVRELIAINMPTWAQDKGGAVYWKMADSAASRVNARSAYVIEFALPRVLSVLEQRVLVMDFARVLSHFSVDGTAHRLALPVSLAIHEGHGRNPHVHLLLSTSIQDGMARSPELWFRRFNPQKPGLGGAKRSRFVGKKSWLVRARSIWAKVANAALIAAGHAPSLDHRSNADRGLPVPPGIHLGPSAAHLRRKQIPAPRVQRHASALAEKQVVEELLADLARSKARLAGMEHQVSLDEHMLRTLAQDDEQELVALLASHPLAILDAKQLKEVASLVVLETDRANLRALQDVAQSDAFRQVVTGSLPAAWQSIRTPAGQFLIQPSREDVVLIGPGYIASDTHRADTIEVALRAASLLPFSEPAVFAEQSIAGDVKSTLGEEGKQWVVRTIGAVGALLRGRGVF